MENDTTWAVNSYGDRTAIRRQRPHLLDDVSVGEVLEFAVLLSVKNTDQAGFERNYNQLKAYYADSRYRSCAPKASTLLLSCSMPHLCEPALIAVELTCSSCYND